MTSTNITDVTPETPKLAEDEYFYCIVQKGGKRVLIGSKAFRSKDGKIWEEWK